LQRSLDHDAAQVGGGKVLDRAEQAADGRPRPACDHRFWHGFLRCSPPRCGAGGTSATIPRTTQMTVPRRPGVPRATGSGPAKPREAAVLQQIDHVGIACHDLETAIARYQSVFDLTVASRELHEDQGVREAMLRVGEGPGGASWIQLLEP